MTIDELEAENIRLRSELATASTPVPATSPTVPLAAGEVEPGMTVSRGLTSKLIAHAHDPKSNEPIKPTIRQDMGVDSSQVFRGRQP